MDREDKSTTGQKKRRFWIIFLGILIAVSAASPDLWAAPGQNPKRQTVPTATPKSGRPTSRPSSTNPSATNPPLPTSESLYTPVPTWRYVTSTPTMLPATKTAAHRTTRTPSVPTGQATAIQSIAPTKTTIPGLEHIAPTSTPATTTTPTEPEDNAGGGSLIVFGGVGLVVVGLILLAVWRLRA